MSNESTPPKAIDALKGDGKVHLAETPDGVYMPLLTTGREQFSRLFSAAFVLKLLAEEAYLHEPYRAMLAASDWLNFDGDRPPDGVRESEAEVLRKVADIRDPNEPDTWDDYEGD